MRLFWTMAFGSIVVLGAAAVWMGGLNQDEGWYLYAANMVADGNMPYGDFFYTQGPLLPYVYSAFTWVWGNWGLLGARVFTLALGVAGIVFAVSLARRLAPADRRDEAGLFAFLLLGSNLYHLYFLVIPKTYALASLFVIIGFYLLSIATEVRAKPGSTGMAVMESAVAGLALAFASGTRISLGALLAVAGLWLLFSRRWKVIFGFAVGGLIGLSLAYLPILLDHGAREGLFAAQAYHAARGGFDITWTVGSLSRLVRWYSPLFTVIVLWLFASGKNGNCSDSAISFRRLLLAGFLAVFAVQMLAPFPYEDYQVPIVGILTAAAVAGFVASLPKEASESSRIPYLRAILLIGGLCFANSFGSPLLEKWATNGQDRFWSLKKDKFELAQLRDVAKRINELDPGGKELLTQDLYLAIETGRKVPKGLEMGPFAMLTDDEWRKLLGDSACNIAAMSGYTFAIEPPSCRERSMDRQMEYWSLLKRNYEFVERHDAFGQNATPLLILKRK